MAIWLSVIDEGIEGKEELYLTVGTDPREGISQRMKKGGNYPYVIEALAHSDDGKMELDDFFEAAFKMGRAYGAKHGPAPRKPRKKK